MIKFIAGVRSKDADVKNAFTSSLGGAVSGIKDYYSQFYSAGSYLVDGFANGISVNAYKAAMAVKHPLIILVNVFLAFVSCNFTPPINLIIVWVPTD